MKWRFELAALDVALATVILCAAPAARAALPRPQTGAPSLQPASSSPATDLEVAYVSGEVALDCRERSASSLECDVISTHRVRSAATEPVEVEASPPEQLEDGARFTIDGAPVERRRSFRHDYAITLQPGQTHVLALRGRVHLDVPFGWFVMDALVARHLVLADRPETNATVFLRTAPPGHRYASRGPMSVRVTLPDRWSFDGAGGRALTLDAAEVQHVAMTRDAPVAFFHGGPLAGVGGEQEEGLRVRVGYDIGFHDYGIAGLDVDVDFDGIVVIAPRVELALPQITLLPSLAAGLGVPVRVTDGDTSVGGRLQLTATLYASFVTSIDRYPGEDLWEVSMFGVLGI